jgi:hypothetical protein
MVQVIPQAPPKHSRGKQFSEAVGKGLEAASAMMKENQTRQGMKDFANTLEANNPDSKQHKTLADLYRSDLPLEHISKIAQSLTGIDPFKQQQQDRLNIDSQAKLYNSAIKNLQKQKESTFNKDVLAHIDSQLEEYQGKLLELTQYAKGMGYDLPQDIQKKDPKTLGRDIYNDLKSKHPKWTHEQIKEETIKQLEKA